MPGISRFNQQKKGSRSSPLSWMDWKYSLIFPIALLLLLIALLVDVGKDEPLYTISISDRGSGTLLANVDVSVGGQVYRTEDHGEVTIRRPTADTVVRAAPDGYRATSYTVTEDNSDAGFLALEDSAISGTITDKATNQPIADASVTLVDQNGATLKVTSTSDQGTYTLTDVPEGATLRIDAGSYGSQTLEVDDTFTGSFTFETLDASGLIRDSEGQPLQGALVQAGEASAVSGKDGRFVIEGVANGAEVTFSASGFETTTGIVQNGAIADAELSARLIKGIYANWSLLTTPGGLDDLIEIANTTEVNAIVIDVKQDTVYFDSKSVFFNDAGTVNPIIDIDEIIKTLAEHDIYAIARIVVFQDPLVAEARPDLAVKDAGGGLWVNENGTAWVSAFNEELWDANIDLAVEVVDRGFDEIQYDYVRFPSDGDLSTAEFGVEYTADTREAAITRFMERSHEAINKAGGSLAADLFGFVTIVDDEQYIGQRFSQLEPHLDYVCMMIYPSHFSEGNIASADGHPNDFPYETIHESLERAEANAPGARAKFRPWLQDFSYGFNGLRDYDKDDVRAQIDAAEEFGASGWLLWGDPFNVTVDALMPEPGN